MMQGTSVLSETVPFGNHEHVCGNKLGKFSKTAYQFEAIAIMRHDVSMTYFGQSNLALN